MKNSMDYKIAAIILNYRATSDTIKCVNSLRKQLFNDLVIVIVDNSESSSHEKDLIEKLNNNTNLNFQRTTPKTLNKEPGNQKFVLITKVKNRGYSSGNNIGIRFAIENGATAILIANPDVVFPEKNTIAILTKCLFKTTRRFVIAPRVIDLNGIDQNPMKELSFVQEVFQPIMDLFKKTLKKRNLHQNHISKGNKTVKVDKVSGCCLMIKSSFFMENGLFDEHTFLYCEEPILSHTVKAAGGLVCYYPGTTVHHLHNTKEVSPHHYKLFINSRMYFLKTYKKYGTVRLFFITLSHNALYCYKLFKSQIRAKFIKNE